MTILTVDTRGASQPQLKLIRDLVAERPNWHNGTPGVETDTVLDVLGNVGNPDPKFVSMTEARLAIRALLKITKSPVAPKPAPTATADAPTQPGPFERLQVLLQVIPKSKSVRFALQTDGAWRFYAVDLRNRDGHPVRFVNELLGAPGSWNRKYLSTVEQLRIARLLAENWVHAAQDYADQHGRCARCDAYLSDARSRAAKVGWKCAKEWGWAW